jgi:hypothetical protein
MKHLFKIALVATALFTAAQGHAQTVKQDAKKVGHKTAEVSTKGYAAVTDKRYKDKVGPHGESIYINKHSHYFYINKTGHRVYLKKSELRDK